MRTYLIVSVAAALLVAGPAFAKEPGGPVPTAAKDAAKKDAVDKASKKGGAKKDAVKKSVGQALLKVKVEPESRVFVDDVDKGKVTELELPVKPGSHIVRFVHDSGDEHENRIVCEPGKTTAYEWKFDYSAPTAADVQDIVIP